MFGRCEGKIKTSIAFPDLSRDTKTKIRNLIFNVDFQNVFLGGARDLNIKD